MNEPLPKGEPVAWLGDPDWRRKALQLRFREFMDGPLPVAGSTYVRNMLTEELPK